MAARLTDAINSRLARAAGLKGGWTTNETAYQGALDDAPYTARGGGRRAQTFTLVRPDKRFQPIIGTKMRSEMFDFARDFFGLNRQMQELSMPGMEYERRIVQKALKLMEGANPQANMAPVIELVKQADALGFDVVKRS